MACAATATTAGRELIHAARRVAGASAVALLLTASGSGLAVAQTSQTLAAADRLIAVQNPDALMKDMAVNVAGRIPNLSEAQKQAFVAEMTNPAFMTRYKDQMRGAFAMHLTAEELDALSDFYSKPIAKSAMKKMGATTAELMTFIQGEIPAMIARISKTP